MKKVTLTAMALTFGLMALVSCNKNKENANGAVFTANIEQNGGQQNGRTALNLENSQVIWMADDQITVANGEGETAIFTLKSGANTNSGIFGTTSEFEMTAPYVAVYPADATIDGTTVTFELPATQTLTQTGTFANGANPMVAYSTNENLQFKNLCGGVGFRLLGDNIHVSGIRITADESEKLNGTFEADCTAAEPVLVSTAANAGNNVVTLNCDVTLNVEMETEFIIILPVGTLAQGFTMEVLDGENVIYTNTLETDIAQVERKHVKCFNPMSVDEVVVDNGGFTVNFNGDRVYFSQGNLQYQASTNTWRFAEHQYDRIGNANANISENYDGWIDLFGWGTSGYNHGATAYQPWSTVKTNASYYAYGDSQYNLYDQTGMADWGYNAISNDGNVENSGWRTLTKDEWKYILSIRQVTSGIRWAHGTVNNVTGTILLPDNWETTTYTLNNPNGGNYDSNIISAEDWVTLEENGAIFLPAAGFRVGASISSVGARGVYWASTAKGTNYAYAFLFYQQNRNLITQDYEDRYQGFSVRLVKDAE